MASVESKVNKFTKTDSGWVWGDYSITAMPSGGFRVLVENRDSLGTFVTFEQAAVTAVDHLNALVDALLGRR